MTMIRIIQKLILPFCIAFAGCTVDSSSLPRPAQKGTASQYPVQIETDQGTIELKSKPETVVCDAWLGHLLCLDIVPKIASQQDLNNPALKNRTEEIKPLKEGKTKAILSQIKKVSPDLILSANPDLYKQYAKIAPTICLGSDTDPKTVLQTVAKAFGKEEQALTVLNELDQMSRSLLQSIEDQGDGQTISILEFSPGEILSDGSKTEGIGRIVYGTCRFSLPCAMQKDFELYGKQTSVFSISKLPDYAGNWMIYAVSSGYDGKEIIDSQIFHALPCVKNGRVLRISDDLLHASDPIAQKAQLSLLQDLFKKRNQNDG